MGKGNLESADASLAREAAIFVADTISETMKQQLTQARILWVELRKAQDWRQFAEALEHLGIPHQPAPEVKAAEWFAKCLDVVFSTEKINNEVCKRAELYHTGRALLVELE